MASILDIAANSARTPLLNNLGASSGSRASMNNTSSGSFPDATMEDEQNIQRLKDLALVFRNMGYKGQLGTKQLMRLVNAMSSLPKPAAPATPVAAAAPNFKLGLDPTTWRSTAWSQRAEPVLPATTAPRLPGLTPTGSGSGGSKGSGSGGSKGSSGGGGGGDRSGEFGKPMTSNLKPWSETPTRNTGWVTGDGSGPSSGLVGGSPRYGSQPTPSTISPTALPGKSPGTLGLSAQASVQNMKTPTSHEIWAATGPTMAQRTQAQLAASNPSASADIEKIKNGTITPGLPTAQPSPGANQRNQAIAGALDYTKNKGTTGMSAFETSGSLPSGTGGTMNENDKKKNNGKNK